MFRFFKIWKTDSDVGLDSNQSRSNLQSQGENFAVLRRPYIPLEHKDSCFIISIEIKFI